MDREHFMAQARPRWRELDRVLEGPWQKSGASISSTIALYRQLCSDLMRARALGCGPDVTSYLDALAARAHNRLYQRKSFRISPLFRLIAVSFPRTLRRRWAFFATSFALFASAMVVGVVGSLHSAAFSEAVLPVETLEAMAEAYSKGFSEGRHEGVDAAMAGFYVYNNVGIAFRCFATGILLGTGSAFFLVYNGLMMGTVLGYVATSGGGMNILSFVSGHSSFELIAIVIAGAAGLQMGFALVDTNGQTRLGSLRKQSVELVTLIAGAAVMLLIAALVEGFWSPSSAPDHVKWVVGGLNLALVGGFLALGGRHAKEGDLG